MFVAMRIWLHILVCWPQPAFPMYRMFVPMHYMLLKKGRANVPGREA